MSRIGPFARYAAHLLDGGYSPIPIRPGTKKPLVKQWDRLRSEPMSRGQIAFLARNHPDLGLAVAGGFNGLVPVDVDAEEPDIVDAIVDALPDFLVGKAGKRGYAVFFRDAGGTIGGRKFVTPPPERGMLVEVLSTGKATIPPTIHPEMREPYVWLTKATLFNTRVTDLPEITPAHIRALEIALRPWVPARPERVLPQIGNGEIVDDKRLQAYARAVLAGEVRLLEAIPKNAGRNHQLFIAICKLGKWAHHKVLPADEIAGALLEACRHNGLVRDDGLRQCQATLASGFRKSQHDALPALRRAAA